MPKFENVIEKLLRKDLIEEEHDKGADDVEYSLTEKGRKVTKRLFYEEEE